MRISAAIRWKYRMLKALWHRYATVPYAQFATSTPNSHQSVKVIKDVFITMRDGVRLCGDLYLPLPRGKDEKFPAVLVRLPYGKNEYYCSMPAYGKYWAKKGYAFFAQDVRGKHQSEGTWNPFVNEAADGFDTISWLSTQAWSDGKVAMTGESYFGYTAWAAATAQHPALKAIAPGVTATQISSVWVYNSNVYCIRTMGVWPIEMNSRYRNNFLRLNHWHLPLETKDQDAGFDCPYYKKWLQNLPGSEYWRKIDLDTKKVTIPALSWGGWYDTFLKGTIEDFIDTQGANSRLLIAPIDHELTPAFSGRVGRHDVGVNCFSHDEILRFFDYHLRGIDHGISREPPVKVFTIGSNRWTTHTSWPPPDVTYKEFYLTDSRTLSDRLPQADTQPTRFSYDPANPISNTLFSNPWRIAEFLNDRSEIESRADVLTFTGQELKEPLCVTGDLKVVLYASSSAPDTDFTATLVDIFPDGSSQLVQEGIVRARYRNGAQKPKLMQPGEVYEMTIDLWHTSYQFATGHRLRIEISSSNFSKYDRNLNTKEDYYSAVSFQKAEQQIFHNRQYPSHLILPIRN